MEILKQIEVLESNNDVNRTEIRTEIEKVKKTIKDNKSSKEQIQQQLNNKFTLSGKSELLKVNKSISDLTKELENLLEIESNISKQALEVEFTEAQEQFTEYIDNKYNLNSVLEEVKISEKTYIDSLKKFCDLSKSIMSEAEHARYQLETYTNLKNIKRLYGKDIQLEGVITCTRDMSDIRRDFYYCKNFISKW